MHEMTVEATSRETHYSETLKQLKTSLSTSKKALCHSQQTLAQIQLQHIDVHDLDTLRDEKRQLQGQVARLLTALQQAKEGIPVKSTLPKKNLFAAHIEVKRENQSLRAQIEEMKNAQRKYLTSVKKRTVTFPNSSSV